MSTKRIHIKMGVTLEELEQLKKLSLHAGFSSIQEYLVYGIREYVQTHAVLIRKAKEASLEANTTAGT